MPLLRATGGRSSASASICRITRATGSVSHARTPTVFCAVTAVMTVVPKTPNWWKVLRSAWIPAPPPESDPAMVRAILIAGYARPPGGGDSCGASWHIDCARPHSGARGNP